jgi:subtilisin family serine protease
MCDFVPGELLACYRKDDPSAARLIVDIRENRVPHVKYLDNLTEYLTRSGLKERSRIAFDFVRLEVPHNEEVFKINILQYCYTCRLFEDLAKQRLSPTSLLNRLRSSSDYFQTVPNSLLSVNAASSAGVPAFTFSPSHADYKKMIGWPAKQVNPRKKIAILDTGIDSLVSRNVVAHHNFVDPQDPNNVTDDNNHGTVVASVIKDLIPGVEIVVYKVADKDGKATEWDTLAALAADNPADVINLSLSFGSLRDRQCPTCGRATHSSRSAVFEALIRQLDDLVVVSAAGNSGLNELGFPSRFGQVVAVESINAAKELSDFTNRGSLDHEGNVHESVFVLPGGQEGPPCECVGTTADGTEYWGTSFAAAYGSATVAAVWSRPRNSGKKAAEILGVLRANSDTNLPQFSTATYGKGLMRYT